MKKWLNIENLRDIRQAENFLRLSKPTILKRIKEKKLRCMRLGDRCLLFDIEDLKKFKKNVKALKGVKKRG